MTALATAVLFVATLGYVLWPVFRPGPLPLEQLEPPPGER